MEIEIKVNRYRMGNKNTKFFHTCASQRKKKNQIQELTIDSNQVVTSPADIDVAFVNYFQNIITSSHPSQQAIEECIVNIKTLVSEKMNLELTKPFILTEIQVALNQMGPLKFPGPDGFNAGFFQTYWYIVRLDVILAALKFLNEGQMDVGINYTYLVLIPKIINPSIASDYRPISLYNVLYKLVSKTLPNRLKLILPFLISKNQSASIPG